MQDKYLKQSIESKIDISIFKSCGIKLAYIFGSSLSLDRIPNDLDIAILFKEGQDSVRYFELATQFYLKLTPLFPQKIDVVILNEAHPFFKYEVITKGELLYRDNETIDIEFKVRTLREYFDSHYRFKIYEYHLLNRIKKGVYE